MEGTVTELVKSDPYLTKEEVVGTKKERTQEDVTLSTSYAQVRKLKKKIFYE